MRRNLPLPSPRAALLLGLSVALGCSSPQFTGSNRQEHDASQDPAPPADAGDASPAPPSGHDGAIDLPGDAGASEPPDDGEPEPHEPDASSPSERADAGDDLPPEVPDAGHDELPEVEPVHEHETRLRGYVTFAPDYRQGDGGPFITGVGQIPRNGLNAEAIPGLFVCAMDRDGAFDDEPLFGAGDDDLLGCAQTVSLDDTSGGPGVGYYDMQIEASGPDVGRELYLVTWFCDNADLPLTTLGGHEFAALASHCVRMNAQDSQGRQRKFLRSPEQELRYGSLNFLNWNLSCPAAPGASDDATKLACSATEEEPEKTGHVQSNQAWNKEFTHVFRTAAEVARSLAASIRPAASSVAKTGCGPAGDAVCQPCMDAGCQGPMRLIVAAAVAQGAGSVCNPNAQANQARGFDEICLAHGSDGRVGTLNPYAVAHEMGHLMQRRFMGAADDVAEDCGTVGWTTGNDEGRATAEGFANFIAVATWWNDTMPDKQYEGISVESGAGSAYAGSCGPGSECTCAEGELNGAGLVTRFFVDLWDPDDQIDLKTSQLMKIWSTFDQPEERDECAPDGRNLADFRAHYDQLRASLALPSLALYDQVQAVSCVDRHRDGATSCGADGC